MKTTMKTIAAAVALTASMGAMAASLTGAVEYTTWDDTVFVGDSVSSNKTKGYGATLHTANGEITQIQVGSYKGNNDHKEGYTDFMDGQWQKGTTCSNGEIKKGVSYWPLSDTTEVGSWNCKTDKFTGIAIYSDNTTATFVNGKVEY